MFDGTDDQEPWAEDDPPRRPPSRWVQLVGLLIVAAVAAGLAWFVVSAVLGATPPAVPV
ncbi:MAG: hypothetical protein ACKO04_08930 [Actinomycetes bacterium]